MFDRAEDWRDRALAVLIEWNGKDYRIGSADCARFASAALAAFTGRDLFPGRFAGCRTRLDVAEALRARGQRSIADALEDLARRHGFPALRNVRRDAVPGDVGVTADDYIAVRFSASWFAFRPRGLEIALRIERAWRVCREA